MNKESNRLHLFVTSVYYNGDLSVQLFKRIVEWINNHLYNKLLLLRYLYYDPPKNSSSSISQKRYSGRITEKRINRFIDILANPSTHMNPAFFITRYNISCREQNYPDILFQLYVSSSGNMIIEQSYESLRDYNIKDMSIELVRLLLSESEWIKYGFSFGMHRDYLPMAYCLTLGEWHLPEEEKINLNILSDNYQHLDEVIWDISWGNIINRKHFIDEHTVDYLKKELGEENVVSLGEDLIWFNLEGDIRDFDKHRSKSRAKLLKYFEPKMARLKE